MNNPMKIDELEFLKFAQQAEKEFGPLANSEHPVMERGTYYAFAKRCAELYNGENFEFFPSETQEIKRYVEFRNGDVSEIDLDSLPEWLEELVRIKIDAVNWMRAAKKQNPKLLLPAWVPDEVKTRLIAEEPD